MTNKAKILTAVTTIIASQDERGLTDEQTAQEVIDEMAEWFEEVGELVGIQPSAIPTLLRWQAHQHEYLDD
jgi:hypothetical protein